MAMQFFVRESEVEQIKEVQRDTLMRILYQPKKPRVISCVQDILDAVGAPKLGKAKTERMITIYVDQANQILKMETATGEVEQAPVYPRKIARDALLRHATGVVLVHNHPTGQLDPSQSDREITRVVQNALRTLDIRLLDHVIIGGPGYFSFRENGLI